MTLNSFVVRKKTTSTAFTIVELVAAMFIVGLCLAAFLKIAHTARQQRRIAQTHQTAVDQLQNVIELLAAADPEQLAACEVDLSQYEALIARALPEGELLLVCEPLATDNTTEVATTLQTWQLDASVSWRDGVSPLRRSVTLTRLLSKPIVIETPPEPEQMSEQETAAGNVSDRFEMEEPSPVETATSEEEGGGAE